MKKKYIVVLEVVRKDGEDHPKKWSWCNILDVPPDEVKLLGAFKKSDLD